MADNNPKTQRGPDGKLYSEDEFPYPFVTPGAAAPAPRDLAVSPDLRASPFAGVGAPQPGAAGASPPAGSAHGSREGTVNFWMGQGAPKHVAEGIADRVKAESGFRPAVFGDQGTSAGLYQHHADRLARLRAFAAQQGKQWTDPLVQHQFALSEVKGGDAIAAQHWQEILNAPDQQTAATLWDRYFERSKYGPGSGNRPMVGRFGGMGPLARTVGGGDGSAALAAALGQQTPTPAAAAPRPAATTPSSEPVQLQQAPAAAPIAPQQSPLRLSPAAVPQAPDLTGGYNEALKAILAGRRRPMGSIFG